MEELIDEVLALDLEAMTEEEARLEGIGLLEDYADGIAEKARAGLGCNLIMVLLFALVSGDYPGGDGFTEYLDYRRVRRTLRRFRRGTYRKGYRKYLAEWQERIREQRKTAALAKAREEERLAIKAERRAERAEKKEARRTKRKEIK